MPRRLLCILTVTLTAAVIAAPGASASQMIAQNVSRPTIKVGMLRGTEVAVVSYRSGGSTKHVLVWGAMNARPYSTRVPQYKFRVNYSGGWGTRFGSGAWRRVPSQCAPDDAVKSRLALAVAACTMKSNPREHWALQVWQRLLPNAGVNPRPGGAAYELHVSHWTDAYMPVLWLKWGWANAAGGIHYDHLFGVMSFDGHRVFGHSSTSKGNPTDSYGRNIYVDAQNRVWASDGAHRQPGGWIRFNGFLTHYPHGDFCASVYKRNLGVSRPGYNAATNYRATAMGPGVTPIVRWTGPPPGHYSAGGFPHGFSFTPVVFPTQRARAPYSYSRARELNDEQRSVAGSRDSCYHVYGPH
jgi:hypothetical protein